METKLKELRSDISELKALEAQATRPKVKDILSLEIRKLETVFVQKTEQLAATKTVSSNPVAKTPVQKSNTSNYEIQLTNYAWDQSDKFVKLFVTLANVHSIPEANVTHELTSRSVILHIQDLESKNYCFKVANLLEDIDTEKSYVKIKKDMITVFLAKTALGNQWSHLTASDKAAKEARLPKLDKDDDPSKGMMSLLQSMYEDGDDDMKRTIASAWTESRNKAPTF